MKDRIRELMHNSPFVPFVLQLTDGRNFQIDHPDYVFAGPSLAKIVARYADLTGHMPLPPKWALGHQQCRYSYYSESVAEEIVRRYLAAQTAHDFGTLRALRDPDLRDTD